MTNGKLDGDKVEEMESFIYLNTMTANNFAVIKVVCHLFFSLSLFC